jgi:hypothetical protein
MLKLAMGLGLVALAAAVQAEPPRDTSRHGLGLQSGQYCRMLTEDERRRLVIEWGKPSIVVDRRDTEKLVRIPAQVFLTSADGKKREPLKGVVIAAVLVAVQPDKKSDWSEGFDEEETYSANLFINWEDDRARRPGDPQLQKEGGLVARIPCSQIQRTPGKKATFQVALSLGRAEGGTAWWSNHDGALKQTVTTVEIEGPPTLSHSMQLLAGLPGPLGWSFEPAPLIRAINHFRGLGNEKAIAVFREFLKAAPDAGFGGFLQPDPENIDKANQWCLSILVPFVFQDDGRHQHRAGRERVVIHRGIPFHALVIRDAWGHPPDMKPLVDSAEKEGKIEAELLKPTNKPLEAADELYAQLVQKMTNEERAAEEGDGIGRGLRSHLRVQAFSLVRHLVGGPDEKRRRLRDVVLSEERWRELKARLDGMKIRWNDNKGMYEEVK